MTGAEFEEISEEVLEEGSYYLTKLGLTLTEVAEKLEITKAQVVTYGNSYSRKLKQGKVKPDDFDVTFWKEVKQEAEGNTKVTFVSEKGFHHAWKSDLQKLDGPSLMAIYESSKGFLDMDPNQRFLDYPAPKGYDPLALQREVKRSVGIINSILEEKWRGESSMKRNTSQNNSRLKRASTTAE